MIFHLVQKNKKLVGLGDLHQLMVDMGMQPNCYSTPSNLTIVLCHNYVEKPYTERHMDYIGLDYVVLQPDDLSVKWRNTNKLTLVRDYIKSGNCSTEYILVLDSDDVVFLRHPNNLLDSFNYYNCDILYNAVGKLTKGHYRFMLDKLSSTIDIHNTEWFLNAGVWMAKTNNILDILETACSYVDDSVWNGKWSDYHELRNGRIDASFKEQWFPDYPKGIPSDQDITRWIYPDFYPRMKIDTEFKFVIRDQKEMHRWFFDFFLDT